MNKETRHYRVSMSGQRAKTVKRSRYGNGPWFDDNKTGKTKSTSLS